MDRFNITEIESLKEEIKDLKEGISEAWQLINILNMFQVDEGEAYPKALFWLHEWEHLRPQKINHEKE